MRQIGELFLLRTNLNSVGSVLDSPVCISFFVRSIRSLTDLRFPSIQTLFRKYFGYVLGKLSETQPKIDNCPSQTYPDLQPLYDAARSYLEIPQRINLLNTRVQVSSIRCLQPPLTVLRPTGPPRHVAASQGVGVQSTRRKAGADRHRANRRRDK